LAIRSRYKDFSNEKFFLFYVNAWIHIRRGGREPALPQAGSNLPLAKRTSQMGNLFYFYKK
jgi:hypothetical protein